MEQMPIILLPGLLSDHRVFHHQLQFLSEIANMQVIQLTDINSPIAMTEKILQIAPKRFALIGHSIGGWVALRVMKMMPERVTKLCILNTAARGINPVELASRQAILNQIEKGEFQSIASQIAHLFVFNNHAREAVLKMFLEVGEQALINQTQAMMVREDLRDILPTIHCSTLVIHAEKDKRFSLNDLTEISSAIPNAALKVVTQCGHMSPMEQPEIITHLIRDWLKTD
jgi:pimeloyl-ACP methyl ester carboxylesterase